MGNETAYSAGLRVGGGIIFLIGLAHIFMPTHGYPPDTVSGWATATVDHFYFLGTYIICGMLLTMGGLSLLYSARRPNQPATYFTTAMAILWTLRLWLEFRYPVDLPIFFVERPHFILVGALAVTTAAYAVAAGAAWRALRTHRR